MFFELIAAFAAGFLGAGLALVAGWLSGGRLPRWLMPVMAGVGMIGYAIWSEYTWFDRTAAAMPPGVEVTFVNEVSAFWRPWTYALPVVDRFAAVDTASIRTNPDVPDARIADMLFAQRWMPNRLVPVMFDCAGGRHAPLATVTFTPDGGIGEGLWSRAGPDDAALSAACAKT